MFKTIHDCGVTLVAKTVLENDTYFADFLPVSAARASFGKQDKTGENTQADLKLMKDLADNKHLTPFEYNHATFLIECPLFIRSQIHRHRTFSYNEISRRYTAQNLEFWLPDKFRSQHKSNKQASGEALCNSDQDAAARQLNDITKRCLENYEVLLGLGVCREQARAVLPQSLITRFYMGGSLRNWAHFIELRRDPYAQYEVQVVANRVAEALRHLWPDACRVLGI